MFGFASCCLGALTPDIVIGLVGDSRLAVTYSYLMLFEAAGFMLGAPFAGTSTRLDRVCAVVPTYATAVSGVCSVEFGSMNLAAI